jgi:hypothetical protein
MRADSWKGLVTKASPFAVPPGAAVEQVNLRSDTPGQLTSRGGMRAVASMPALQGVMDCCAYEFAGKVFLVALNASGQLIASESPAYGSPTPRPVEPQLSVLASQVATSYTQRYLGGSGAASDPPPPAPGQELRFGLLYGGQASTASWPYKVNANDLCAGANKTGAFTAGSAATSSVPPSLTPDNMCAP